jgi:hypothetical protein
MSVSQTAFLEKSSVPDRAKLEEVVRALGFDLSIGEFPLASSGFLPCILRGKESGFEIRFETPEEEFRYYPHLKEKIGHRDCALRFRWADDMAECACVLIVSAALATRFGAIVHEDGGKVYTQERLLRAAKEADELAQAPDPLFAPTPRRKSWWKFWE